MPPSLPNLGGGIFMLRGVIPRDARFAQKLMMTFRKADSWNALRRFTLHLHLLVLGQEFKLTIQY